MVSELNSYSEFKEYIRRNKVAVVAIANKDKGDIWLYVKTLLSKLEEASTPKIGFAIVHYQHLSEALKTFEIEQARRSVIIKLFLNGETIFEQEGIMGTRINDEIVLKRGIRESLKQNSIDIRFRYA